MKNLKEKFMNKNGLRVAFSIGAAVIALSTSAYTNRLVAVTYINTDASATSTSTDANDYEYQPTNSCTNEQPARNCSFTTMEDSAPAVGSHPTQSQVDDAADANAIQKGKRQL